MTDLIDRAKLEALAEERYCNDPSSDAFDAYMQAVDDLLALLDAETTEEWGVEDDHGGIYPEALARQYAKHDGKRVLHRHVLYDPWLPSEGGEKRG